MKRIVDVSFSLQIPEEINHQNIQDMLMTGMGDIMQDLKMTDRIINETSRSINETPSNLFLLFDEARNHLKYPRLTFKEPIKGSYPEQLRFRLNGPKSKVPGAIDVTDGLHFPNNAFYARIYRGANNIAQPKWYRDTTPEIRSFIETVIGDPIEAGKISGQKFAHCIFCGRELTAKNSLTVGYGPICAEVWGLPWEGTADEEERKLEREALENL